MATIQVTTYRLIDGTKPDAFVSADAALQEWTYLNVPGIARRTTARSADGTWITIRLYADSSQTGTDWFDAPDPVVVAWRAMVDEDSIESRDYDLL